jgi:thymidylate kinase
MTNEQLKLRDELFSAARVEEEEIEDAMKVREIFNKCEDDYSSAMLLVQVAKHFESVSESVNNEDKDYLKVVELIKKAAKLMSR